MTSAAAVLPGWNLLPRLPESGREKRRDRPDGTPLPRFALLTPVDAPRPATPPPEKPPRHDEPPRVSRYDLLVKIGAGGTASVYIGRVTGSAGFSRLVAVKRAHPHLTGDPSAQKMLVTEARLASGINHANVVAVQDVEHTDEELLLIMDYVEGASLAELLEAGALAGRALPSRIAIRVSLDACAGLAAVHELEGPDGRPVGFLHRDVSPQNLLVGIDGLTRITDFGLAKRLSPELSKATGCLKGKLAYLAPEIIDRAEFSVQSDIFAMAVVLWEALAKQRLFRGDSEADTVRKVGLVEPPRLSKVVPELGTHLDNLVAKALDKDPLRRYGTVRQFAAALEGIAARHDLIATSSEVSGYVRAVVGEALARRRELVRAFDGEMSSDVRSTQTVSIVYPQVIPIHSIVPAAAPRAPAPAELTPTLPKYTQYADSPEELCAREEALLIEAEKLRAEARRRVEARLLAEARRQDAARKRVEARRRAADAAMAEDEALEVSVEIVVDEQAEILGAQVCAEMAAPARIESAGETKSPIKQLRAPPIPRRIPERASTAVLLLPRLPPSLTPIAPPAHDEIADEPTDVSDSSPALSPVAMRRAAAQLHAIEPSWRRVVIAGVLGFGAALAMTTLIVKLLLAPSGGAGTSAEAHVDTARPSRVDVANTAPVLAPAPPVEAKSAPVKASPPRSEVASPTTAKPAPLAAPALPPRAANPVELARPRVETPAAESKADVVPPAAPRRNKAAARPPRAEAIERPPAREPPRAEAPRNEKPKPPPNPYQ